MSQTGRIDGREPSNSAFNGTRHFSANEQVGNKLSSKLIALLLATASIALHGGAVSASEIAAPADAYPQSSFGERGVPGAEPRSNLSIGAQPLGRPIDAQPQHRRLRRLAMSADVRDMVLWIASRQDNHRLPFVVIDKRNAAVHVFDNAGALQASSAALLGLAHGDQSVPGIGERPMSQIAPEERTTPAGRFESEPGRNLQGIDIVWIDYDAAVSLHRVRTGNAAERRAQRLASPTADDNRISYGCVNLPTRFYNRFIAPTFGQRPGVIYVLPETEPVANFFGFQASAPTR